MYSVCNQFRLVTYNFDDSQEGMKYGVRRSRIRYSHLVRSAKGFVLQSVKREPFRCQIEEGLGLEDCFVMRYLSNCR